MAKLDRELQSLDHERRLTAQARIEAEVAERQLRARDEALREREAQFSRKLEQRLNDQLREARVEVDKVVADLRQQAATLEKQQQKRIAPIPTGVTGDLRALCPVGTGRHRRARARRQQPRRSGARR